MQDRPPRRSDALLASAASPISKLPHPIFNKRKSNVKKRQHKKIQPRSSQLGPSTASLPLSQPCISELPFPFSFRRLPASVPTKASKRWISTPCLTTTAANPSRRRRALLSPRLQPQPKASHTGPASISRIHPRRVESLKNTLLITFQPPRPNIPNSTLHLLLPLCPSRCVPRRRPCSLQPQLPLPIRGLLALPYPLHFHILPLP